MAHSQPFTTLVYQHHPTSDLSGSSPADNGRQYTTFQWRGTNTLQNHAGSSLRQAAQGFYANATSEISPTAFTNSFDQDPQAQLYTFQLDSGLSPGRSRQIESSIGPQRRVFSRRRSARLQRLRGEISHDHAMTMPSSESRYELHSTTPRSAQFAAVSPLSHYSDSSAHSRDFENYSPSQFSSPTTSSMSSEDPWGSTLATDSPQRSLSRGTSPTSTENPASVLAAHSPEIAEIIRHPKKRVSSTDKAKICRLHEEEPELRQQDIAKRWGIERSTVSKILKNKERWLSISQNERRTIFRQRDTKFPQLEEQMQVWLRECHEGAKPITDSSIREKAKSLVPELVLMGTFKASAGWLDNFKQRNGIKRGRWTGVGTRALNIRATGADYVVRRMAEAMDTSGVLPPDFPRSFLQREGALPPTLPAVDDTLAEDVEMGEEPGARAGGFMDADLSLEQSDMTPSSSMVSEATSPSMVSEATSPAPSEEPEAMQETVEQPMDVGVGGHEEAAPSLGDQGPMYDQDGSYDHHSEPYAAPAGSYVEPYPSADPYDPSQEAPIDDAAVDIDTGPQVENLLDAIIVYFNNQEGLLADEEREMLGRIKHVLVDHNTTGIVDRSRYV